MGYLAHLLHYEMSGHCFRQARSLSGLHPNTKTRLGHYILLRGLSENFLTRAEGSTVMSSPILQSLLLPAPGERCAEVAHVGIAGQSLRREW